MTLRSQVFWIIVLTVALWVVTLIFYGAALEWNMLKPFGTTVSAVTIICVLFEKFMWKWPIINGFIVQRPPLCGTWKTELLSSYKDDDGNRIKKTVFVVIHQTLLTMSLRMYTDKARSFTLAESIRPSGIDDLFEVAVVYQNVPYLGYRQGSADSQIHYGALLLTDVPPNPGSVAGSYWTDRNTNGEVTLLDRKKERVSSYAEGAKLFGVAPQGEGA
jgi:hypothetical protein